MASPPGSHSVGVGEPNEEIPTPEIVYVWEEWFSYGFRARSVEEPEMQGVGFHQRWGGLRGIPQREHTKVSVENKVAR